MLPVLQRLGDAYGFQFNNFVILHAQKLRYFQFRSEICYLLTSCEGLAIMAIWQHFQHFSATFSLFVGFQSKFGHHHSTRPPKFCKRGIFYQAYIFVWSFLSLCMRRNGRISTSDQRSNTTLFFIAATSCKSVDNLAAWQQFAKFSRCMPINGYL